MYTRLASHALHFLLSQAASLINRFEQIEWSISYPRYLDAGPRLKDRENEIDQNVSRSSLDRFEGIK